MHENHVAHRCVVTFLRVFAFLIRPQPGTARLRTSCLTHQICIIPLSTLPTLSVVKISAERLSGIRERDARSPYRLRPFPSIRSC